MKKDALQDKWKKVPENSTPKSIECIGASQDISEIRLRRTSQLLRSDPIWKWQACNFRNRATRWIELITILFEHIVVSN